MRVLLTLDLVVHGNATEVPGILRNVWQETPAVLPEVAAALPALYQARPALTASRRGVVALSIAEQPVGVASRDGAGTSKAAYSVSVIGALAIDAIEGADLIAENVKEDVERFAGYVFQLDGEDHGAPAPEIAGSRVVSLKAEVDR
jgi:hypothetical protein